MSRHIETKRGHLELRYDPYNRDILVEAYDCNGARHMVTLAPYHAATLAAVIEDMVEEYEDVMRIERDATSGPDDGITMMEDFDKSNAIVDDNVPDRSLPRGTWFAPINKAPVPLKLEVGDHVRYIGTTARLQGACGVINRIEDTNVAVKFPGAPFIVWCHKMSLAWEADKEEQR